MWDKIDKELSSYLSKYKRKQQDLKDNLQSIFDTYKFDYKDMNKYVKTSELNRFKRYLEKAKDNYNIEDYVLYRLNAFLDRKKVKYSELVKFLILLEYTIFNQELKEFDTFTNISQIAYDEAVKECQKLNLKTKGLKTVNTILLAIALMPNDTGMTWSEYSLSITLYNANEMYKNAIQQLSRDGEVDIDDALLEKQQRAYLNRTPRGSEDKFSGMFDKQEAFVVNQTKLSVFQSYGVEEVQFIARMDNKTTEMCESLNGQIFKINGWNNYQRYSKADDKIVSYKTYGLVVGDNLPPINNGFHWCRSSIEARR